MVRKLKGAKTAGGNQADIVKQAQVMQQQIPVGLDWAAIDAATK